MGEFCPHAVAALGLPKSSGSCEAPKPSVEVVATPERSESGVTPQPTKDMPKPAEGTPQEKEVQQFSMGVTLPTVPARLVKRILAGEFVDMGELSQEAKFKRISKGEDQKPLRESLSAQ